MALLAQVLDTGVISYHLGSWEPPWGIEYRIDLANAFVLLIVAAIGAVVLPFARASVAEEIPTDRAYLFYALYLLCFTGLLGIANQAHRAQDPNGQNAQAYSLADAMRDAIWRKNTAARLKSLTASQNACADGTAGSAPSIGLVASC